MQLIPIDEAIREIQIRDAKEEGLEKGLERGMKKGKKEKALEVARSMLTEGLSVEIIKKCTGLDKEDILVLG